MSETPGDRSMASKPSEAQEQYFEGDVPAAVPLALLESVRAHDHPGEVLEDEDLTVSLPRRFGLSGVVENQIMRYESARRAGKSISLNEVLGLVRLVLRRPDAELILREAGVRMAEWRYARLPKYIARAYRALPLRLTLIPASRAAGRLFRDLGVGGDLKVQRSPMYVRVQQSNTARLDPAGVACALFTAALEHHLKLYTGREWNAHQPQCEAFGGSACEWRADPAS